MKPVLARLRLFALAAVVAIVSAGCLEWDQQVLTFRYDRKSDTLRIFQDYRGIYGADKREQLSAGELKQLESVLQGGRTFFFANWILELNLQKLPDMIADLREETAERVSEEEMNRRGIALMEFLLKNCRIENGDFYLDDEKRISGVQRVTITRVSQLLTRLESAVRSAYKDEAVKHPDDLDSQTYLNTVSAKDWWFIRFEGGQLVVRFPLTKADYEKEFRNENNREPMDNFEQAGIRFVQRDGVLTIRVGNSKSQLSRVQVDTFAKEFRDNLRAHLPDNIVVKEKYDADAAARKFVLGK